MLQPEYSIRYNICRPSCIELMGGESRRRALPLLGQADTDHAWKVIHQPAFLTSWRGEVPEKAVRARREPPAPSTRLFRGGIGDIEQLQLTLQTGHRPSVRGSGAFRRPVRGRSPRWFPCNPPLTTGRQRKSSGLSPRVRRNQLLKNRGRVAEQFGIHRSTLCRHLNAQLSVQNRTDLPDALDRRCWISVSTQPARATAVPRFPHG